MSAETTIYNLLKDLAGGRVTPLHAVQASNFPYIVYRRVSTVPFVTLCGDSGSDYARIQVDIVSDTYEEARTLARTVRATCKTGVNFESQIDLSEPERNIYRIVQDYQVFEEGF